MARESKLSRHKLYFEHHEYSSATEIKRFFKHIRQEKLKRKQERRTHGGNTGGR